MAGGGYWAACWTVSLESWACALDVVGRGGGVVLDRGGGVGGGGLDLLERLLRGFFQVPGDLLRGVDDLTDTAKEIAGNLKEPAQQAMEEVKSTATDAAATVKDDATAAADDVKSRPRTPRTPSSKPLSKPPPDRHGPPGPCPHPEGAGMTNATSPDQYIGRNAVDPQGNKIGSVGQVYLDDQTGQPDWITVNTGLFGTKENFAPLAGSRFTGDDLVLPFDKDVVKDSPDIADASHLDLDEQQSLYAYYQQYLGDAGGDRAADTEQTTDRRRPGPGGARGMTRPARTPTRR